MRTKLPWRAGLGLPIVHGLVKLHGGEMRIRSMVGEGTEVLVIFPPKQAKSSSVILCFFFELSAPSANTGEKIMIENTAIVACARPKAYAAPTTARKCPA